MASRITWDTEDELKLWADICQKSFYWFVRVGYGLDFHRRHKKRIHWFVPRIHKPICDWYQMKAQQWLATRKSMNIMILIPRFFGKTTLITRAGQLWLHLQDPDLATYTGSESRDRAVEFVEAGKKIIDGSDPYAWFTFLWGNWYNKDREWAKLGTTHAARRGTGRVEPSFGVWGVETGLTGRHPDAGFLDDPISYESMATHSNWLQMVNDHVASLVPVFADTSFIVWPGTRYGDGDHFGTELRQEGVCENAGMPLRDIKPKEGGKWHVYYLRAREADSSPILPEVCSDSFLKEYERKNHLRYWAQMMNDPASSDFTPLTLEQIYKTCVCDPKIVPKNMRHIVCVDTAFSYPERQTRGDETVIIHWGATKDGSGDVFYLEGYGSRKWQFKDFADKLITIALSLKARGHKIWAIVDETELGGHMGGFEAGLKGMFAEKGLALPPIYRTPIGNRKKLTPIIAAAGFWSEGYVKIPEGAPGAEQLIDQMSRIGLGMAHDDWADAGAKVFFHKVYKPAIRPPEEEQKPVEQISPMDFILKPIHELNDKQLRQLYDWDPSEYDNY